MKRETFNERCLIVAQLIGKAYRQIWEVEQELLCLTQMIHRIIKYGHGRIGGLWFNNDISNIDSRWVAVNDFWDNLSVSQIIYDPLDTETFYVSGGLILH